MWLIVENLYLIENYKMAVKNLTYLIKEKDNGSTILLEILSLHIEQASKLKPTDIEYKIDEELGICSMFVKELL